MTEPARDPLVSVCIANYNGEAYIEEAIESVLNQELDQSVEIIVHDDASTDNSVDFVRSKFPSVRVIQSSNNVGFCVSNNRMAEQAKGKFLLLLNNDASLREGSLESFLSYSRTLESPAILGLPQYSATDESLIDRGYEFDLFMNPIPMQRPGPRKVAAVTGACMWIPKKIWNEVGGFPDWFGSVAEDIYICQAARLLGYSTYILEGPGFDHWIGRNLGGGKVVRSRLDTTVRRRRMSERNKTYVMVICFPRPLLLITLPLHLILLIAEGLMLAALKREKSIWSEIYLHALLSIYQSRGTLRSARRRIQNRRYISAWEYARAFSWKPHKLRLLIKHGLPIFR